MQATIGINNCLGENPPATQAVHSPLDTISEITDIAPSRHATGIEDILGRPVTGRPYIQYVMGIAVDPFEGPGIDVDSELMGDCRQVENGVGRA